MRDPPRGEEIPTGRSNETDGGLSHATVFPSRLPMMENAYGLEGTGFQVPVPSPIKTWRFGHPYPSLDFEWTLRPRSWPRDGLGVEGGKPDDPNLN